MAPQPAASPADQLPYSPFLMGPWQGGGDTFTHCILAQMGYVLGIVVPQSAARMGLLNPVHGPLAGGTRHTQNGMSTVRLVEQVRMEETGPAEPAWARQRLATVQPTSVELFQLLSEVTMKQTSHRYGIEVRLMRACSRLCLQRLNNGTSSAASMEPFAAGLQIFCYVPISYGGCCVLYAKNFHRLRRSAGYAAELANETEAITSEMGFDAFC